MSGLRARLARGGGERGVTLVETVVYCALLVLVLPLAGSVLVSALESQRDVEAVTTAGTSVQTVTRSLELGVRNASAVSSVVYRPVGTTGQYDEFVVVRTQEAGSATSTTWRCQAWFYDAARDVLYTRSAPAAGTTPVIPMPVSGSVSGWTTLAEKVTPRYAGWVVFSAWTGGLITDLQTSAGVRKPVVLATAVTKRTQWETGSAPCF